MNFSWYMARRLYSRSGGTQRASRSAIAIATAGVTLGLAVMIIAISVVLGFKTQVQNKVVGIGSHISILNYQSLYSSESQPIVISDSLLRAVRALPEVSHAQRFCVKTGMLKTDDSFQGVLFRGVDETYNLDFLRSQLVDGELSTPFSSKENTGRIALSQTLSQQLHLSVGDRVFAYFFDDKLRARRFTVTAIYATHLSEYDSRLVFCDYRTAHQLLGFEPDQSSGAEVAVRQMELLPQASAEVSALVNHRQDRYGGYYSSPTIKDTYPHIFAWLDLLDLNVVVILLLMIAVAGFTTVSGLLIIILERTQFIGVLKALGASNGSLRHLFLYYAILIVGRGMLLGNLLGIGLCYLQQTLGLVHLDAETYYVDTVPVLMSWPWVAVVNVAIFVAATLSLLLPTLIVSHIHPARSIRFE
ncbi:MAG: ABC transporter permease [Bacteroidaceae bacterium]|nr:ABC transporter permease [Bacteroidaceae bacterium]